MREVDIAVLTVVSGLGVALAAWVQRLPVLFGVALLLALGLGAAMVASPRATLFGRLALPAFLLMAVVLAVHASKGRAVAGPPLLFAIPAFAMLRSRAPRVSLPLALAIHAAVASAGTYLLLVIPCNCGR